MRGYLEAKAAAVGEGEAPDDATRLARRAVSLVLKKHMASHPPLAEQLRSIARSHPNTELRRWARSVLVTNLEDATMRAELVALIDRGARIADPDLAEDAACSAMAILGPAEARDRIEKLVAKQPKATHESLWAAVAFAMDRSDPAWTRIRLAWWKASKGDLREVFFRTLRDVDSWASVLDLDDPLQVDELIALDREAEDAHVAANVEAALATVKTSAAVTRALALLEQERSHSPGGSNAAWLLPLFDTFPAKTFAPLLGATVPKAVLDEPDWIALAEAILGRKEPDWRPVRNAIAGRLTAMKNADFDDVVRTLHAP